MQLVKLGLGVGMMTATSVYVYNDIKTIEKKLSACYRDENTIDVFYLNELIAIKEQKNKIKQVAVRVGDIYPGGGIYKIWKMREGCKFTEKQFLDLVIYEYRHPVFSHVLRWVKFNQVFPDYTKEVWHWRAFSWRNVFMQR